MIISFDIFDTLITRTTATPKGIFALMQEELQKNHTEIYDKLDYDFFSLRVNAERRAENYLKTEEKEEITLLNIYQMMESMTVLSRDDIDVLMKLEVELECRNMVMIPENVKRLKEYLLNRERVVLISDMYLSQEDIRKILINLDPVFKDIPIYVSSDFLLKKSTGNLYRKVRIAEKKNWNEWLHIGDNPVSDLKVPKSLGMLTDYYEYKGLLECEKDILKNREKDVKLQLFIGTSRNERIYYGDSVAYQLGVSYGAAIILQYVEWVFHICKKKKIKDLYFVARDGYILYEVAKVFNNFFDDYFNLKYIYGSRKAWMIERIYDEQAELLPDEYEKSDLLKGYLEQEINFDAERAAFVEVHGQGNTQKKLVEFIQTMSNIQISSFYFIQEQEMDTTPKFYSFTARYRDTGCVIEQLTRALHGRTIGYRKNNKIEPILLDDENECLKKYGLENYFNGVTETVKNYFTTLNKNRLSVNDFKFGLDYYEYLISEEKGLIFDYLCDMPMANTIDNLDVMLTFAPKYTKEEIEQVKDIGYLPNKGFCQSFSRRRCTEDEEFQIKENKLQYINNRKDANPRPDSSYSVHFDRLKQKVVLYGAGRVGCCLAYKLLTHSNIEIVAWVDKKFDSKDGIKDALINLKNYDYDQIVVAVKSKLVAEEIFSDLTVMGVNKQDIFWEDYERTAKEEMGIEGNV